MGRELRRKQAKKEGKSLKVEIQNENNQIKKLLIITVSLVLCIGLLYILSALFITKEFDWFDNDSSEQKPLVANTILASEIFKQKEEEYYVYFYDYTDEDEQIANVMSGLTNTKIYRVDTSSAFNKNYVSEESNKSAKSISELKVKASTVIKISGETIHNYYENDEIINNLGNNK